jgi:hypothetical protein
LVEMAVTAIEQPTGRTWVHQLLARAINYQRVAKYPNSR